MSFSVSLAAVSAAATSLFIRKYDKNDACPPDRLFDAPIDKLRPFHSLSRKGFFVFRIFTILRPSEFLSMSPQTVCNLSNEY